MIPLKARTGRPFIKVMRRIAPTLFAALAVLSACAGADSGTESAYSGTESADNATESAEALEAAEACGAVFTPDAELADETAAAAARWAAATGCDVRVGPGGVRVRLVAELWNELGNPRPGLTHSVDGRLVIDVTDLRIAPVIPHEIGHVLRLLNYTRLADPHDPHVVDGVSLMCSDGGAGLITEADLLFVCEGLPCEAAPEA